MIDETLSSKEQGLREASGPRGLPLVGVLPRMWLDVPGFFNTAAHRYGDIVRFKLGPQETYLVSRPEDIKHIFQQEKKGVYDKGFHYQQMKPVFGDGVFNSNGEAWRRRRRLLQPFFTKSYVANWHEAVTAAAGVMLDDWHEKARNNQPVDLKMEMRRLVESIMARILFATSIPVQAAEKTIGAISTLSDQLLGRILSKYIFRGILNDLPSPANRRFKKALQTLDQTLARFTPQSSAGNVAIEPLISLLRQAKDQETRWQMNDTELRDQVVTIYFAGQDTTANGLAWTFHYLSQHPNVAARIQAEVDEVLGGNVPTFYDLSRLTYTDWAINESLRLSPPAYAMARTTICEDIIRDYRIPSNSLVTSSQYVTHRHPAYWESPDKFDPERFSQVRSRGRPRYAFFPFGGGQRTCLGMHLAMMEMTIVTAMVMKAFVLQADPRHRVTQKATLTLRPRHGIRVWARAR
jgi:cytochrome P450